MFIRIHVAGCSHFAARLIRPRRAGPGGDGGHGGNVVVEADASLSSLIEYRFKHHFKAERGTHGKGSRMHGATGEDLVLKVPMGTVVEYFEESKEVGESSPIRRERVTVAEGDGRPRHPLRDADPTRDAHVPAGADELATSRRRGNVVVEADASLSSLSRYRGQIATAFKCRPRHARQGQPTSRPHGATERDLVLKVPVGTALIVRGGHFVGGETGAHRPNGGASWPWRSRGASTSADSCARPRSPSYFQRAGSNWR